jgi:uncharacterized protein
VGYFLGMLGALGLIAGAYLGERPELGWASSGLLGLVSVLLGLGALRTFRAAQRRYAPRTCCACGSAMRLLDDAQDDASLEPGQRAEEQLRSFDYDVWKCTCGEQQVERNPDAGYAARCPKCGYRTERSSRHVIQAATGRRNGLAEDRHHCAHCQARRVEQVVLPRVERHSASSGHSSSGSSSSRSSSSGQGSSFGGGRSGGGGAGGSY